MPELPEVETVVRTLEKQVGLRTVESVNVIYSRIIDNKSVEEFSLALKGQKFEKYDRRGKFLVFTLTDYIMIVHLRMEGKFYYFKQPQEPFKHTHLVFNLDEGQLHYNDVRKFGRFYLYRKGEELTVLKKLGLEPFDEKLTAQYCRNYCRKSSKPVKQLLLDQGMIAGIGNIYASEICFEAKINPNRSASRISLNKWDEIIAAVKKILGEAIAAGGTTIRSYTSSLGVTGLFQQTLAVYGRDGQACPRCSAAIIREKTDGRSTYYCPDCQKEKPVMVAVTGSMGSGKSEVTRRIAEKGYFTISCDEVNRDILKLKETSEALSEIFECDPAIVDKAYISQRIFSDEDIRLKAENYLHQKIKETIEQWAALHEDEKMLFVEVPLLFETDWYRRFDLNVDVYCPEEILYERLTQKRKISREEVTRRLTQQLPIEEKKQRCDYLIDNSSSEKDLEKEIERLLENI